MSYWIHSPLFMAISAMLAAQIIKVPIHWLRFKRIDLGLMFSTGRMPSSHSAMVTSMATGIGLSRGWNDDLFTLATVFALIVMYDALGIRRHAGKQATILNQLVKDVQIIISTVTRHNDEESDHSSTTRQLKELLGHEPLEVLFGAFLGVGVSFMLHFL